MGAGSLRPGFHFTAGSGWINDPHGITWRDGGYDVFFQFVPGSLVWQPDCHWGHARGEDLLSLRELPVAIAPGEGDDGMWTGSLVRDAGGGALVFYTATSVPEFGIGRVRTATPVDEGWIGWVKGPVVVEAPAGLDLVAFRDPFVRREGAGWRMFVGGAGRDGTAMALTWVSEDLGSWRYDGVALARSGRETVPVWTGALWECPQVFPLGDRWVMVSSVWDADTLHYVAYALGSYAGGRFTAETWGRLTYGSSYYAPSLFVDGRGRACMSFWMRGVSDPVAGWVGAHSLPHVLSLQGDRLVAWPHPDVERYHHEHEATVLDAVDVDAVDVCWDPAPGDLLRVWRGQQVVATIERTLTGLRVGVGGEVESMPAEGQVRIVVDGPVLELATTGANFGAAVGVGEGGLTVTTEGTPAHVRDLVRTESL
ncbi:MAG: glycoside hydrolase family 32 protein [Actinobacteria bacterium]|nr:glycoside hydrolase family 32 protein [Actinomycetota bacterium]